MTDVSWFKTMHASGGRLGEKIVSRSIYGLWTAEKLFTEISCARNLKRMHLWRFSTCTDMSTKGFSLLEIISGF